MKWISCGAVILTVSTVMLAPASPAATKKTTKKPTTTKQAVAPASTAVAASTVPQSGLDKLIAAAKKEGSLTLYSSNIEEKNTLISDTFSKQYGIKVDHVPRQSGSGLTDRYQAERKAGGSPADAFLNTGSLVLADLGAKGLLMKLDASNIPALKGYPASLLTPYSIVANVAQFTVCFNTSQLKASDLQNWYDVLLPKNGVKLLIPSMTPDAYWPTWDVIRTNRGIDFLKLVGDSKPRFVGAAAAGMQLLTSGEGGILFPCAPALLGPAKAAGAPVSSKDIYPVSGVEFQVALADSAPHPNAARLFANWLATTDGQIPFGQGGAGASPLLPDGDVSKALPPMPEAKGYITGDASKVKNYQEIVDALGFKG